VLESLAEGAALRGEDSAALDASAPAPDRTGV
jgi:hypothetical protein